MNLKKRLENFSLKSTKNSEDQEAFLTKKFKKRFQDTVVFLRNKKLLTCGTLNTWLQKRIKFELWKFEFENWVIMSKKEDNEYH